MARTALISLSRAAFLAAVVCVLASLRAARADIFRWDNHQLIPGTQGITPGPGVMLDGFDLSFANLQVQTLTGASFRAAVLTSATFDRSILANADFSDTEVLHGNFNRTTENGFTSAQLYSTASYQRKDLQGILLTYDDLSGWNFRGQNLRLSSLGQSNLTGVDLTNADLTGTNIFGSVLTNVNLTDSEITGAILTSTTDSGFNKEQLYSTASYRRKDVNGIILVENDLSEWDFNGQNLRSANLAAAVLNNTNFSDAEVEGVSFWGTTSGGFTKEQLYSTASYRHKVLRQLDLRNNDLSGWTFAGQNLQSAKFAASNLSGADFRQANLTGSSMFESALLNADLSSAEVNGVNFAKTTLFGFSKEQFYSTATYRRKDIRGIVLDDNDLTAWDFSGQDFTGVTMLRSAVTGASFAGTNLTEKQLSGTLSYQDNDLQGISFAGNDLTGWDFNDQNVSNANFSAALIAQASFVGSTLTKEQLYSTGSYQQKNLQAIALFGLNLAAWDFSGQDLRYSQLDSSMLTDANLANADLRHASLETATLNRANFQGAVVTATIFADTGLTKEQLYSTASYQQRDLQEIVLLDNDLTGWDFSDQHLMHADLNNTLLAGANFSGAWILGAKLRNTVSGGFAREQLYSTASYQQKNLRAIDLGDNDLSNWDFSGQDLTGAELQGSRLRGTNFSGAMITGAKLGSTVARGFTKEQLYSTRSYQEKNLQGVWFRLNNLSGWNFSGQDLRGADFFSTTLIGAEFSFADLRGASSFAPIASTILRNTIDPDSIVVDLALLPGETLVAHSGAELPVGFFGEFSIAPTAKLDTTDNAVIVYEAPAAAVRAQLIVGRGRTGLGGAWTGNGIASSTAAAANQASPDARSIGYALNGTLPLGPYAEFRGFPVDENSVLVAYTRTGDANLDGVVNDDDVTVVGTFYAPGVSKPEWAKGDFDYNGFVDDDDVTLLGVFYDPNAEPIPAPELGGASNLSAVPEPATLAQMLCAIAAAALVVLHAIVSRRRKMAFGNTSRDMLAQV